MHPKLMDGVKRLCALNKTIILKTFRIASIQTGDSVNDSTDFPDHRRYSTLFLLIFVSETRYF